MKKFGVSTLKHYCQVSVCVMSARKLSRMWAELDLSDRLEQRAYGYMDLNEFNTVHKVRDIVKVK